MCLATCSGTGETLGTAELYAVGTSCPTLNMAPLLCANMQSSSNLVRQHAFLPATKPPVTKSKCMRSVGSRRNLAVVKASSDNPARQVLSGFASNIYKLTASFQEVDQTLPPLWQGIKKLDLAAVQAALRNGADPNMQDASGDTLLIYIAREGHYKYPPSEIPNLLIQSGANLEAKDKNGKTALQIALLSGWQNIAELLIKNGANTRTVTSDVKAAITCPDCKRIVATYNL